MTAALDLVFTLVTVFAGLVFCAIGRDESDPAAFLLGTLLLLLVVLRIALEFGMRITFGAV